MSNRIKAYVSFKRLANATDQEVSGSISKVTLSFLAKTLNSGPEYEYLAVFQVRA